jgi:hypothetical protein
MNKRIKELALQAGLTQAKDFKSGDEVKNFVFGNGLEKFAELIVRECAEVAQMNTPDTEECEYTHLISEKIREHFGVEE